jgi:hypothetical protein
MTTVHTATPWHVVDDYHPTRACLEIQDSDHYSIATIYNGPGDDDMKDADGVTRNDLVRVANASFIVTACNAHDQLTTEIAALVAENEALHEQLSRKDEACNNTINAALMMPDPVREPVANAGGQSSATKEMLNEAIDDKVARAEDLMSDFPPHRAMERFHEANAALKEIIDQLFHVQPTAVGAADLPEAVAVIGSDYQLLWCRQDWSKGLKVGDFLCARKVGALGLPALLWLDACAKSGIASVSQAAAALIDYYQGAENPAPAVVHPTALTAAGVTP